MQTQATTQIICPNCGEDKEFRSREWVQGHAFINVYEGSHAEWSGETDMNWDTSRSVAYFCCSCDAQLPEDMQKQIDKALGNKRYNYLFPVN